jgi:hypothetical protein
VPAAAASINVARRTPAFLICTFTVSIIARGRSISIAKRTEVLTRACASTSVFVLSSSRTIHSQRESIAREHIRVYGRATVTEGGGPTVRRDTTLRTREGAHENGRPNRAACQRRNGQLRFSWS